MDKVEQKGSMDLIRCWVSEIAHLDAVADKEKDAMELCVRYLVKVYSAASENELVNDSEFMNEVMSPLMCLHSKGLQSVAKVFLSEMLYNRTEPLENTLEIGFQNFTVPECVDENKYDMSAFRPDPRFLEKNVSVGNGLLKKKNIYSALFDV